MLPDVIRTKWKVEYFDLETCPQPIENLQRLMPDFQAPSQWKDPDKIAKAIEEKRAAWIDSAALSPLTGQILAAVWVDLSGNVRIADADLTSEAAVIEFVFDRMRDAGMGSHYKVAGFNIGDFDIPWLIKRAWVNGVKIPPGLLSMSGKWSNLPSWLIDIRHLWGMGEPFAKGSLGTVAELLGVGEKKGEGKDFARNWRDPGMHAEAFEYLCNDGVILPKILERLIDLTDDQYGLNLQPKIK